MQKMDNIIYFYKVLRYAIKKQQEWSEPEKKTIKRYNQNV